MKAKLVTISAVLVIFLGCQRNFGVLDLHTGKPPREFTPLEKQLAASSNAFGFSLFRRICEGDSGNLFLSPLSVSMALSMTLNGARGETETAMKNTLGFGDMSMEEVNQTFQSLVPYLTGLDPKTLVSIANSIWIRQEFTPDPLFIQTNETYYSAEVERLDFSSPDAVSIINSWVNEETHGLIPEIIESINPLTVMFLMNAIYFRGVWTVQFDPDDTEDASFWNRSGQDVGCRMMFLDDTLRTMETDLYQAADLSYGSGNFAMAVFLPKNETDMDAFVAQFDQNLWEEAQAGFTASETELRLPRFEIDYKITLNDILKGLGMASAFDPNTADFTGIHANGGLYIQEVLHRSFVAVDEEGTKAAAVTSVDIGYTSFHGITFNRPFVFVIYEKQENTLLFMGRVDDPGR